MNNTINIRYVSKATALEVSNGNAGIDLTAISIDKDYGDLIMLNTGVMMEIPDGYYGEIHARSSLPLKGYSLANSVGIIDSSYRGELKILLRVHDLNQRRNISFPFRCAQLIIKKCVSVSLERVDVLSSTTRGSGGFGSTD